MKHFLIFTYLITQTLYSQNITIPDPIFKSYILTKCDTNNDGNVQLNEANLIDSIIIESMGISDLTGMEFFASLSWIQCGGNNISILNTYNNPALKFIHCNGNQIVNIDVSNNPLLYYLECRYNQLISLDFRNRNNGIIPYLDTRNNQNLLCVSVDDTLIANSSIYFYRDVWTNYSTNCTLGIEEDLYSNISMYPNPTSGNFTLDLKDYKSDFKVTITNNLGSVILIKSFVALDKVKLYLSAPSGIYYLKIETTKGQSKTLKLIKT